MKTLEELKKEFYSRVKQLPILWNLESKTVFPDKGLPGITVPVDNYKTQDDYLDEVWQFIEEAIKEEREETKTIEEWEEDFWDIMRNDFGVVDFSGTQARAYELKQFISELIEKEKESAFDLGYITGRQVAIESIVN